MPLTTSSTPNRVASPTTGASTDEADELELRFLNCCLGNATQVHYLVTSSFTDDDASSSSLLEADAQHYMKALLNKYAASATLRSRLSSGDSLYFLHCLTDEATRGDFVRVAAAPLFPLAAGE